MPLSWRQMFLQGGGGARFLDNPAADRDDADASQHSALAVVSALVTPGFVGDHDDSELYGTASLRKYAGYAWKKSRAPPFLWKRRWVEVTLEGFGATSFVALRPHAESCGASERVALPRSADGVAKNFVVARFCGDKGEPLALNSTKNGGLSSLARGLASCGGVEVELAGARGVVIRLRADKSTEPALVSALAALGWPPAHHKAPSRSNSGSSSSSTATQPVSSARPPSPPTTTKHAAIGVTSADVVQSVLLALGDVRRAAAMAGDVTWRQRMRREADAIAARGLRAVLVPPHASPGDRVAVASDEEEHGSSSSSFDAVVPVGVARGSTFYVPGGVGPPRPTVAAHTPPAPPPRTSSARPSPTQRRPNAAVDADTDRLIARAVSLRIVDDFSARRMRRASGRLFSVSRLRSVLTARLRHRRDHDSCGLPEYNDHTDEDDGGGLHALLDDALPRSASSDDGGPPQRQQRHQDELPEQKDSDDGPAAAWSPRARLFEDPLDAPAALAPPEHREAPAPPFEEEEEEGPPPSLVLLSELNDEVKEEDVAAAAERDGVTPLSQRGADQQQQQPPGTDPSAPPSQCAAVPEEKTTTPPAPPAGLGGLAWPRRYRQVSDAADGERIWEGYVPAPDSEAAPERNYSVQHCEAVVPKGVRGGQRLLVRIAGADAPQPVVVPHGAEPGNTIRFPVFRVCHDDGTTSVLRWPDFPHDDLQKAPAWRRQRLAARLKDLRAQYAAQAAERARTLQQKKHNPRAPRPKPYFSVVVRSRARFLDALLGGLTHGGSSSSSDPTKSAGLPALDDLENWRKPWRVSFAGEPAMDAGGVSREFWSLVSERLFKPDFGLFRYAATDNYTYEISTLGLALYGAAATKRLYRIAGRLVAKAVLERAILSAVPSRALLKHVVGCHVCFDDLVFVDAALHANLRWLLTCAPDEVELLCLTFTVADERLGVVREVELVPGGAEIAVDATNRVEYVDRRFAYAMIDRHKIAVSAFLAGFYDIVPRRVVAGCVNSPAQLDSQDLELVLCGTSAVDVDDWMAHTTYREPLSADDRRCRFFWRLVGEFDDDQRARLLQFVTGTARLPAGGFAHLQGAQGRHCNFELAAMPGGDAAFIRSHTCFNRLDLPDYSTYDHMKLVISNVIAADVCGFSEE